MSITLFKVAVTVTVTARDGREPREILRNCLILRFMKIEEEMVSIFNDLQHSVETVRLLDIASINDDRTPSNDSVRQYTLY